MHECLHFGSFSRATVCAAAAADCASAALFGKLARNGEHQRTEKRVMSWITKAIWIMMTGLLKRERARRGRVVVPFGIIKTKSSARERRNEKYSRIYAKRKAKGKSFCWLNYINMTNDFFGERDRARWLQTLGKLQSDEKHCAKCAHRIPLTIAT